MRKGCDGDYRHGVNNDDGNDDSNSSNNRMMLMVITMMMMMTRMMMMMISMMMMILCFVSGTAYLISSVSIDLSKYALDICKNTVGKLINHRSINEGSLLRAIILILSLLQICRSTAC